MNVRRRICTGVAKTGAVLKKNEALILMILGLSGGVSATIMACKAAPKAKEVLEELKKEKPDATKWDEIKAVAPIYAPSACMGLVSAGCIAGSYHSSSKKTAALSAAYGLSEAALKDYQTHVIEQIGENKERKVREAIIKEKIKANPAPAPDKLVIPEMEMLCYDMWSGRYFHSTMDKLKNAQDELNRKLNKGYYHMVSINEFYSEIDIREIPMGDKFGWKLSDDEIRAVTINKNEYFEQIKIDFTSEFAEDGRHCTVISWLNNPVLLPPYFS